MKQKLMLVAVVVCLVQISAARAQAELTRAPIGAQAQPARISSVVKEVPIDADSAAHETITTFNDAEGWPVSRTNRYTIIATGMNVPGPDGGLVPASTEIEIDPAGGAMAQKTSHAIHFSADITDPKGVTRFTARGKTFLSRPLCISYWDSATGKSVLISQFRSTVATLVPGDNRIVWRDCSTDFKCNLYIDNQLAGMDQCLEILEQPPAPSEFGLNNDSTRLELITEFFEHPVAAKLTTTKKGVPDDAVLDFGNLMIPAGKAFKIGDGREVHVAKRWMTLEGRDCLIEQVPYSAIEGQLRSLPQHAAVANPGKVKHMASLKRVLPKRVAQNASKSDRVQIAKNATQRNGVILDYTIITSSANPYTFLSGSTYLVTNNASFPSVTMEGGTVIKYYGTGSVQPSYATNVFIRASSYNPVVLTAWDDDSVGELISGSDGTPSRSTMSAISTSGGGLSISNMVFRYFGWCVNGTYAGSFEANDVQAVNCFRFIDNIAGTNVVRNGLFHNVDTPFVVEASGAVYLQNVTVHNANNVYYDYFGSDPSLWPSENWDFRANNCLFVNATNLPTFDSSIVGTSVTLSSDTGVFTTVGAGAHYLPSDSPYHGAGDTNVDAVLLSSLPLKTTYAPLMLTNKETTDVTLTPVVGRDSGPKFDLGYHYDPLDYITWVYTITNATLTITNGAAIGYYQNAGIWLQDGATIYSQGTPVTPNRFAFYQTVQEQSTMIDSSDPFPVDPYRNSGVGSSGFYRFTCFNRVPAQHNLYDFYLSNGGWVYSTLEVRDCTFMGGGGFHAETPAGITIGITNCLFEREGLEFAKAFSTTYDFSFYNNLLHGGSCDFIRAPSAWVMRDNIFYTNSVVLFSGTVTHDHNAYINASTNSFPTNTGDILLTNFTFQTGPLGNYYQPTNSLLINAGSQYATNAGLFHYTTTTNEVVETNTVVDIGLHYIAVDSSGNPLDSDGDGTPDYLEDANGNGTVDSGETDWQDANDLGLKVWITNPRDGSNLP